METGVTRRDVSIAERLIEAQVPDQSMRALLMTDTHVMTQPIPQWTFGDRVRKVRRELHLSQADLASRLSAHLGPTLSTSTIGSWESANSTPSDVVETARALQHVTGIPAEWFLGLHEQE